MLSLSLFSTKLSLCCNLFCFGVRSRCIFASLRNFWTTSISFTFFLSILFDNTSASYTEFFLFDIFQLSFNHHTVFNFWGFTMTSMTFVYETKGHMDRCNGISTAAPQPRFEYGSNGFHWRGFPCLTQTMKMSQISSTCETHNHVKRPHLWSFFSGNLSNPPHVTFYPLYTWHPQKHELAIVFSFFLLSWIDFCTHSKPCKDGYSDHRTAQWLQGYACHN